MIDMYASLVVLSSFAFLYCIVAGKLEKSPISGAALFILFGIVIGPLGLDWIDLDLDNKDIRILVDLTLALILYSDAAKTDKRSLQQSSSLAARMLLIAMPMVILLGWFVGSFLFSQFSWVQLAILATMLCATDAALGKAVVTDKRVPVKVRTSLNVESGLNDGLSVPFLLLFITLANQTETLEPFSLSLKLVLEEIGIGTIVGVSVSYAGIWLANKAWLKGWMPKLWQHISIVMLALLCFSVAQELHGSGYIAAYVGGLTFRFLASRQAHVLVNDTEGTGETLAMMTWIAFGAVVIPVVLPDITSATIVYGLASLTIVRIVPVLLSLVGTGLAFKEKLFMAWFGPRGLASIAFMIIVINQEVPNGEQLAAIVTCTVLMSALLHGVSANLLIGKLFSSENQQA